MVVKNKKEHAVSTLSVGLGIAVVVIVLFTYWD